MRSDSETHYYGEKKIDGHLNISHFSDSSKVGARNRWEEIKKNNNKKQKTEKHAKESYLEKTRTRAYTNLEGKTPLGSKQRGALAMSPSLPDVNLITSNKPRKRMQNEPYLNFPLLQCATGTA